MRNLIVIVVAAGALYALAQPRGGAQLPVAVPSATPTPGYTAPPPVQGALAGETLLLRQPDGHFYAQADVNYGQVRFMVDTGATIVALSQDDARRANIAFDPAQFAVVGSGASGPVYGQPVLIDSIAIDGKRAAAVPGVVLRDAGISLLGQAYLRQLAGVTIEGERMVLK